MKVLSRTNLLETRSSVAVSSKLLTNVETFELYQRKARALKIVADCKQYISSKILTEELKEHADALKAQDATLSTLETIVILLDYTEREFLTIEKLEKGEANFMARAKNFFHNFLISLNKT